MLMSLGYSHGLLSRFAVEWYTSETDIRGPPNLIGCIETACKSTRQKGTRQVGQEPVYHFGNFICTQVAAGLAALSLDSVQAMRSFFFSLSALSRQCTLITKLFL